MECVLGVVDYNLETRIIHMVVHVFLGVMCVGSTQKNVCSNMKELPNPYGIGNVSISYYNIV